MNERLDYPRTFTLGLGFFAISLCWALYNAFVPVFLSNVLADTALKGTLIGLIMTFDNIAAVTLQPYFGAASDRTWNEYGRRMPYILVGMPLGAVFFALVPVFRSSLAAMMTALIAMNLVMSIFRAPTVALMPDITPPALRSKANGVINLMGGLGALLAFFVGSRLYKINPTLPFVFAGILMILITLVLRWRIREPEVVEGVGEDGQTVGILDALGEVRRDPDRSAMHMLLAIFFWFIAWNGIEAFFTLYGKDVWGISESSGALYLGFFSLALVAFAIPAGFLATSIGRARTIKIGIVGLAVCLAIIGLVGSDSLGRPVLGLLNGLFFAGSVGADGQLAIVGAMLARASIIVPAVLALAGMFWAAININSYPMVVDMAARSKTGAYTGLYYLFSSLAAITGPPVFGFLRDLFGMRTLFPFAVLCTLVALIFMTQVKRGEPEA